MKIAFVSSLLEPTGGDDILLHHIFGLKQAGHTVDAYFTGIMSSSKEKYGQLIDSVIVKEPNEIQKLDLHKYDLVVTNGLFGAELLFNRTDINKAQFLQNFDPWIFGASQKTDDIYNSFNKILLYSSHLQTIYEHYYGKKKIVKCNNGIDFNSLSQIPRCPKPQNQPSVCFCVAYYRPYKGIKLANEVFKILKSKGFRTIEICSVNGPLESTMEFFKNPKLERKCEIISGSWIMLHPSVFETWNLVSMESMALGTPVVGTNSKGIMEYATPDNAIIVEERDPHILAQTIEELYENNEKYHSLVENGENTARKHDWSVIMPSIEKNYMELI